MGRALVVRGWAATGLRSAADSYLLEDLRLLARREARPQYRRTEPRWRHLGPSLIVTDIRTRRMCIGTVNGLDTTPHETIRAFTSTIRGSTDAFPAVLAHSMSFVYREAALIASGLAETISAWLLMRWVGALTGSGIVMTLSFTTTLIIRVGISRTTLGLVRMCT